MKTALILVILVLVGFANEAKAELIVGLSPSTPVSQTVNGINGEVVTLGSFKLTSMATGNTVTEMKIDIEGSGSENVVNYYKLIRTDNGSAIATSEIAGELLFTGLDVSIPANTFLTVRLSAVLGMPSDDRNLSETAQITATLPLDSVQYLDWQGVSRYAPDKVIDANTITIVMAQVPEPSTFILLTIGGLFGLGFTIWAKKQKN